LLRRPLGQRLIVNYLRCFGRSTKIFCGTIAAGQFYPNLRKPQTIDSWPPLDICLIGGRWRFGECAWNPATAIRKAAGKPAPLPWFGEA
jgi:hypothetical protein